MKFLKKQFAKISGCNQPDFKSNVLFPKSNSIQTSLQLKLLEILLKKLTLSILIELFLIRLVIGIFKIRKFSA